MRLQRRLHVPHDLPVRALMAHGAQLRLEGIEDLQPGAIHPRGGPPPRGLTAEQQQAVARRSEPLLLSAAAGSGKTSVLVERFVGAIREDRLAPGKILAITFTDRAAAELRERVRTRLLELGEREAARDTEAAFVGTFHGFCARLLRAHPLPAGLEPDFAILDEGLASRLRRDAFTLALRRFVQGERPEVVDLLGAYGVDRLATMIDAVHAQLRSRGQRLPRLPPAVPRSRGELEGADGARDGDRAGEAQAQTARDAEAAAACVLLDELLAGFTSTYEQLKRERGAVDFDDLELCARQLLEEHEGVRAAWSERFELLMVDEFQDTNPRQLGILRALERENLFTVGDEHQSIYGFRHADVSLFRRRRDELAERGGCLALTRNFRSRPPLLDVVNAVFQERFDAFAPLVPAREHATAQGESPMQGESSAEGEPSVELLLSARDGWEGSEGLAAGIARGLPPAPLWRQAEARMLAQRVAELVGSGCARAGEVAVLMRALGDVEVYERALQLHGLRTLAAVGSFWEHQQVGDLLAYLRALANPLDEQALYDTLASPLVGISRDGLALLARAASAGRRGLSETACSPAGPEALAGLPAREPEALSAFCERLRGERASVSRRPISVLIERAIDASNYREHALALEWGERRLANVHKLLRLARRFEASEGRDLRAFLDHVAHLKATAGSQESDAPVEGVEPDAVRLMSIHAAKGLEFPVVCVADLGRAPNTRMPDLLVDGDRIGLQLARLDGARAAPALDFAQLCQERRRAEAEEEERILYVAMTRARERLLLSGAVDFERWPEPRQGATPISWLGPVLAPEVPALAQSATQEPVHELTVPAAPAVPAAPGAPAVPGASAGATVRCLFNAPGNVGAVLRVEHVLTPGLGPTSPSAAIPAVACAAAAARPGATVPEIGAPDLATLSYSSLSELERCGYRYYLERVLGMGEDRAAARALNPGSGRGLEARARGRLVHALLESLDFARAEVPSTDQVTAVARRLGMRLGEAEGDEIVGLIDVACRSAPAARVAAAEHVRREHPFAFSLGARQPLVTGVIDLLAREADGRHLVLDYKSDRIGPDVDLAALVDRDYGVQRLLYALAVLRDGAASVEIVHWFLARPNDWVGAAFTAADRSALEERLAARLRRAWSAPFEVSPRPHRGLCLTCPGRGGLCSWSEEATLREDAVV